MYILNPRLAADIFDNEYIIANLDTVLYYSIQGIAVSLVQALPFEDPSAPINKIALIFNGSENNVADELKEIWQQLVNEEIVKEPIKPVAINEGWVPVTNYAAPLFNRYADMQDLLMLDPIHEVDEEGWPVKKD
jgi:hypothetical protein